MHPLTRSRRSRLAPGLLTAAGLVLALGGLAACGGEEGPTDSS